MLPREPYAPPKAKVGALDAQQPEPQRLPLSWVYVLTWIVGSAITLHALFGLYSIAVSWDSTSELASIDPTKSPMPVLLVSAARFATGALIVLRRKWLFAPMLLWLFGLPYFMFVLVKIPVLSVPGALVVAEFLAIFGFCACLAKFRYLH